MERSDFYVGQTVYVKAWYRDQHQLEPRTVESVGSKYVRLSDLNQYRISDGEEKVSKDYGGYPNRVYVDPEEYYREIDRGSALTECVSELTRNTWHISYEQLKKIAEILGVEYKKCERKYRKD